MVPLAGKYHSAYQQFTVKEKLTDEGGREINLIISLVTHAICMVSPAGIPETIK